MVDNAVAVEIENAFELELRLGAYTLVYLSKVIGGDLNLETATVERIDVV